MKTSAIMDEIRKIRDESSLRHLKMTYEELTKEFDESIKWFAKRLGPPAGRQGCKNRF